MKRHYPEELSDLREKLLRMGGLAELMTSRATQALVERRGELKYFEAGMDLNLSADIVESFEIFQGRLLRAYEAFAKKHAFTKIDSNRPIEVIQEEVRAIIRERIDLAMYKAAPR